MEENNKENIIIGNFNDKTCSWPTPEREAQTIKIINDMNNPIPKELLEKVQSSEMVNIKSDSLYQWALETALSLECVDKDINLLMIAEDVNTGEVTHVCHAAGTNDVQKRIDTLIRMVDKASQGRRNENNEPVANEIFTIIANICGVYCAQSPETLQSFMKVIEYYTKLLNKDNTKDIQN